MARDDYVSARDKLATALELTPQDSDAHFSLGNARKAAGDVDGAIEAFRASLAINADDWELCYNLGVALGDKGELAEEAVMYRKAIAVKPDEAKARAATAARARAVAARAATQVCFPPPASVSGVRGSISRARVRARSARGGRCTTTSASRWRRRASSQRPRDRSSARPSCNLTT